MRTCALSLWLLVSVTAPVAAADYFVKNGGSNGADGASIATAWATLQHAANVVNPGDTVHVQDGDYQGFHLSRSGAPGSPITFIADGPNVQITADNGTTIDGINIENASHAIIDGFNVNNRTRAGIRTALSSFITVRNCRCGYNGRWGIFSGHAYDFTIENNETHHSGIEHGIYVSNSGDRPIIRGNVVHGNAGSGIHMNGDISQGGDGIISEALVEGNVLYDNGTSGSAINMDGVSNSVVRNNLIYDNHNSGISLYRIDGAGGSTGNLIINNTILNASNGRWCININNASSGNTLRNNILYNNHSFRGVITIDAASRAGFSSDYNTVMSRFSTDAGSSVLSFAAWQAEGYDSHSIVATPLQLFVAAASDFHLNDSSPAADAGTAINAPAADIEGNPRPLGAGYDIGAYERLLLLCNDGNIDDGESCGEPGLSCADACTSCNSCACVPNTPVCGDGIACGSEQCESADDCAGGQSCDACQCVNPPLCSSGVGIARASLRVAATPFALRARGEAILPKPWLGVDPAVNGMRIKIDASNGDGDIDLTVPGGSAWKVSPNGTTSTYKDRSGAIAGVTRIVVRDRSSKIDGLLTWSFTAKGGSAALPSVDSTRTTVVLGTPNECAQMQWNPPSGGRPRCRGSASKLNCR